MSPSSTESCGWINTKSPSSTWSSIIELPRTCSANVPSRAMLRATDDLTSNHFVSDASWAALAPLGDKGRMDLVMTVGQYTQVSMMLNSFGIQVEDGWDVDPDLRG